MIQDNKESMLERPKALQDRVFKKLFEQAEIARYSETERCQYEESKKVFWDNYSVLKTAEKKGVLKTASKMKDKGFSVEDIADITGLSVEEIAEL
jgi:predicted transposase/invertase (TIGR01784 family)